MAQKRAFITGITGQDGSYLATFLLAKGYEVHGLYRRSSVDNMTRLKEKERLQLHVGDLTDGSGLCHILHEVRPDEIYHLGAQSDVAVSFKQPVYSTQVNALGTLHMLEAIRLLRFPTRFYQASTSELFGKVQAVPQCEKTPFYPCSPYAVAKLYAYWITVNYREAYGLFAANGILFNHESPVRGESFVTRKITRALGRIMVGRQQELLLGNLDALRDWGSTQEFVEMQWHILQQNEPDDYVIATGEQHSVREFVEQAAGALGITLSWEGEGLMERAVIVAIDDRYPHSLQPGNILVRVDKRYFRPAEVDTLLGDPSKAFRRLGWKPKTSFSELVAQMALHDYRLAIQEERQRQAEIDLPITVGV